MSYLLDEQCPFESIHIDLSTEQIRYTASIFSPDISFYPLCDLLKMTFLVSNSTIESYFISIYDDKKNLSLLIINYTQEHTHIHIYMNMFD